MPFIHELKTHLAGLLPGLRRRRAYADLLQVEVAIDITADAATEQARAGRLAYTAEQADREAEQILRTVLADNRVTPEEIPLLRTALRNIHHSAEADHRLGDTLHV